MQLKIISWNIWTDGYFEQVVDFLKRANADIIGLQEVVEDDPKRDIIGFLSRLGYGHVFAPVEKNWGDRVMKDGPAVFTRHKILKSETFTLSKSESRAAAKAEIQIGTETLNVFCTHLVHTHQKHSDVQDEQATNLLKLIPQEHAILMGDFNAEPNSSAIKIIENFLVNADLNSKPTWSVYPQGCNVCNPKSIYTKLDYIFTTKDISTIGFKVENSKASDHLPISVVIEI